MRNVTRTCLMTALALAVAAGTAAAQAARAAQPQLGSHMAYQFDVRHPGLGAQADVPVIAQLSLYPSGAVYMVDNGSLVGLNADVKYRLPTAVYVGGGLNLMRRTIGDNRSTDTGVNLLGGVEGQTGRLRPFAEGRVSLNGGSAFQVGAGLNIALR